MKNLLVWQAILLGQWKLAVEIETWNAGTNELIGVEVRTSDYIVTISSSHISIAVVACRPVSISGLESLRTVDLFKIFIAALVIFLRLWLVNVMNLICTLHEYYLDYQV
jgi:hypothetical protein